jgi:hypothetical protein
MWKISKMLLINFSSNSQRCKFKAFRFRFISNWGNFVTLLYGRSLLILTKNISGTDFTTTQFLMIIDQNLISIMKSLKHATQTQTRVRINKNDRFIFHLKNK